MIWSRAEFQSALLIIYYNKQPDPLKIRLFFPFFHRYIFHSRHIRTHVLKECLLVSLFRLPRPSPEAAAGPLLCPLSPPEGALHRPGHCCAHVQPTLAMQSASGPWLVRTGRQGWLSWSWPYSKSLESPGVASPPPCPFLSTPTPSSSCDSYYTPLNPGRREVSGRHRKRTLRLLTASHLRPLRPGWPFKG